MIRKHSNQDSLVYKALTPLIEKNLRLAADDTYVTLGQIYPEGLPEESEKIWNFVGVGNFLEKRFKLTTINPVEWWISPSVNGKTLEQVYTKFSTPDQKKLVQHYRSLIKKKVGTEPVVIYFDELVDGYHRVAAAALEGITSIQAVDLAEPLEEKPEINQIPNQDSPSP